MSLRTMSLRDILGPVLIFDSHNILDSLAPSYQDTDLSPEEAEITNLLKSKLKEYTALDD